MRKTSSRSTVLDREDRSMSVAAITLARMSAAVITYHDWILTRWKPDSRGRLKKEPGSG
jgi:hypothetical protein